MRSSPPGPTSIAKARSADTVLHSVRIGTEVQTHTDRMKDDYVGQRLSERSARDGCLVFRSSLSPGSGNIKETTIKAKHRNTDKGNNKPGKQRNQEQTKKGRVSPFTKSMTSG